MSELLTQAAAQVLVANGANVNACNSDMDTPLLLAVKGNHYSVASFLVKQVDSRICGHRFVMRDKVNRYSCQQDWFIMLYYTVCISKFCRRCSC